MDNRSAAPLPPRFGWRSRLLTTFYLSLSRGNLVTGASNSGCNGLAAWVETLRGVSNIYMAGHSDQKQCQSIRVTNFTADDGQEISSLSLNPHGSKCCQVAFVMGPTAGANPSSFSQPPSASTWLTEDPCVFPPVLKPAGNFQYQTFSPNGSHLVYVTDGDPLSSSRVFSIEASIKPTHHPRFLFGVKQGAIQEVEWKADPDTGKDRMLFSNPRGNHGFVGIWTEAQTRIQWVSASVDTDANP